MSKIQSLAGETSALLRDTEAAQEYDEPIHHDPFHHRGSASVMGTIINEAHTCMGTGCLALPFATKLGGILLHTVGIFAIALWNVYAVERLCQCLYLLPKDAILYENEEDVASQSSSSSESDDGNKETDCAAFELSPTPSKKTPCHHRPSSEDALPRYNETTPPIGPAQSTVEVPMSAKACPPPPSGTSTYSRVAWYAFGSWGLGALDVLMMSLFIGVIVTFVNGIRGFIRDTPFTTESDILDSLAIAFIIGPISTVKDIGYLSKASTFGIVALFFSFGVIAIYGLIGYQSNDDPSFESTPLNWVPQDGMKGVSTWFGSTVFGYGIGPLTYNFLESMAHPKLMVPASTVALLMVAVTYVFMGVGVYFLFRHVDGDILHVLPAEGWLPTLTRLSMAAVVSLTAPLLIVPCGQLVLVEGKILQASAVSRDVPFSIRAAVRIGVSLLCVSISVLVPGFVSVLSLVGSGSVAAVGFVMPPAIFLRLRLMHGRWKWDLAFDVFMLLWGLLATGITTTYTFEAVMSSKV